MIICNDSVLIHFHIFPGKEAVGTMAASSRTPAEDVRLFLLQSNVKEQKTLLNLQHYLNCSI